MLAAGIDEHARGDLSQFTESDFYRPKRQLRENGFHRNGNHCSRGRGLHYLCPQIHRQAGKD